MEVTTKVCDVCHQKDRPTETYEVKQEDGTTTRVDLCNEHAEALVNLIDHGTPVTQRRKTRARKAPEVLTEEELEKRKRDGTI